VGSNLFLIVIHTNDIACDIACDVACDISVKLSHVGCRTYVTGKGKSHFALKEFDTNYSAPMGQVLPTRVVSMP
jgi:hypothetical protein